MPLDMFPVVHARALQLPVVELEAERFDQVKHSLRRRAEACDIACVRRDLRFDENYIHARILLICRRRGLPRRSEA
jgi:hypothetical protein